MLLCTAAFLLCWPQAVHGQTEPTATPDGSGAIYIEVQPNDSLWAVAARAGLSLTELLELNGLTEDDVIQPGQQLIVGFSTPQPTPTVVVVPTERATLPPPTPSRTAVPPPPTGVCLSAFTDQNGDGIQDRSEPLKAAVAFTIFTEDLVVTNYVTDGISEPYCLENMAEGEYHITRSVGHNERLTTPGDRGIIVRSGTLVDLVFGSVADGEGGETAVPPVPPASVIGKTAVPDTILENEPHKSTADAPVFSDTSRFSRPSLVVIALLMLLLIGDIFFIIRRRQEM